MFGARRTCLTCYLRISRIYRTQQKQKQPNLTHANTCMYYREKKINGKCWPNQYEPVEPASICRNRFRRPTPPFDIVPSSTATDRDTCESEDVHAALQWPMNGLRWKRMCLRCHRLAGHHVPSQTNRHLPIRKHVHRNGMNKKAETNKGKISLCGCVSIFVSNAFGFPRLFSHFRYIVCMAFAVVVELAAVLARALAALLCTRNLNNNCKFFLMDW